MSRDRMTPEDWIAAAFRRLGQGGIAAVRAEAIARDLGVSKGSFYWHFKDLPDLKARMLAHWLDQATARIVALAEAGGSDPALRLTRLMELATGDLAEPYGGLSTEAAIRDWARTDPEAAAAQAQADRARGAYLEGLLAGMGLEAARAGQAARLILMAYTGAVHRGIRDRAQLAGDLAVLTAALLSPSGR
ncbi:TetR/AcrR family transcriptional regulator [Pararhodobacter aggregans]